MMIKPIFSVFSLMVAFFSFIFMLYLDREESILMVLDLSISLVTDYQMVVICDSFSLIFLFTVGVVSGLVIMYSSFYMGESLFSMKFMFVLSSFILSMFLLCLSGDLFWVMLGWDGLGLSSFCLIYFYQNWKSFNSAMVTFLINRMGDFMIISCISFMLISLGMTKSWTYFSFISIFLCIGAFSKSAQVPFSSWLPLAMAAPTPVSSLVHSSTLVTAGVFLLIRFFTLLSSSEVMKLIFMVGLLTVMLAGVSSLGEFDLKKVIALSTLSHVGIMVMFIGTGSLISAKIHLLIHAFFKSMLFMISGMIIHSVKNCQDIRYLNMLSPNFFISSSFLISLLSMMGIPFLAGFYSKEVLLEQAFMVNNMVLWVGFMLAVMFTCSYSTRLIYFLLFPGPSSFMPMNVIFDKEGKFFFLSSIFSTIISPLFIYMFLEKSSLVFFSFFSSESKLVLLISMVLGVFFGAMAGKFLFFFPSSLVFISHNMWSINSLNFVGQKKLFNLSNDYLFLFDVKGLTDLIFVKMQESMGLLSLISMKEFYINPLLHLYILTSMSFFIILSI